MTSKQERHIAALVVVGIMLRASGLINPIHEIMHMLTVETLGGVVLKLDWSMVTWNGIPQHLHSVVHGSAYWMELALYGFIVMVWKSPVALGIIISVFFRALVSVDFATVDSPANYFLFGLAGLLLVIKGFSLYSTEKKTKSVVQQIRA